jgi:hypothetical protein
MGDERGNVDDDSTKDGGTDIELVVLTTLYDPMEAQIIAARLRSASIESVVKHDAMSAVYGLTVDGLGKQEILVRADDLAEARAALAVDEGGATDATDDASGDEDDDDCEC